MTHDLTTSKPLRPAEPALDLGRVLEQVGGDESLLAEMLDAAIAEIPGMLSDLRLAVAGNQLDAVRRQAHGMKGALLTLGTPRAARAAKELENLARAGQTEGFEVALTELGLALECALDAIAEARVQLRR